MKDNETYYDAFSTRYDKPRDKGYHAYLDEAETRCISEFVGGRVLEAGCGTGLIMTRLKDKADLLTGIDISMGMLKTARSRGLAVFQGDVTSLPFADNTFDLTYSFKVLAHIPHIRQAVSEMVRVTRPGGWIAAEFYNRDSFRFLIKQFHAGMVAAGITERDVFLRFDTLEEFTGYFPENVRVVKVCSARHCLLSPVVLNLPVVSRFAWKFEELLAKTPARRLGGFVTVVFQKQS